MTRGENEPRYVWSTALLSRRTHDRLVMLVPGNDTCMILGGTGIDVWECFADPTTLTEAVGRLSGHFGRDTAVIRPDITPLIETLLGNGVLAVSPVS